MTDYDYSQTLKISSTGTGAQVSGGSAAGGAGKVSKTSKKKSIFTKMCEYPETVMASLLATAQGAASDRSTHIKLERKYSDAAIESYDRQIKKAQESYMYPNPSLVAERTMQRVPEYKESAENAQKFLKALEQNKASLIHDLGITSEEYDSLASLAMGIAEQETHFIPGGATHYLDTNGKSHGSRRAVAKQVANEVGYKILSKGVMQLRYSENFNANNPKTKRLAEKYGIRSADDYANDMEKSAIATILALSDRLKVVKSSKWQNILQNNNAQVADKSKQITENDLICLLWNKSEGFLTKIFKNRGPIDIDLKKSDPDASDGCEYAKLVRAYRERLFGATDTHY